MFTAFFRAGIIASSRSGGHHREREAGKALAAPRRSSMPRRLLPVLMLAVVKAHVNPKLAPLLKEIQEGRSSQRAEQFAAEAEPLFRRYSVHQRLRQALHATRSGYATADPFPHAVFEDLLPRRLLKAVADELPGLDKSGCLKGVRCFMDKGKQFRKSQITSESAMGNHTRAVFSMLRSTPWIRFLEALTGISGLIPDPAYVGSGVHLVGPGGQLEVHADFNHWGPITWMHRRVNTFVFLNDDWPEQFGGHLELWNRNMSACQTKILPSFGRFVAFTSTDFSYHGHPDPMPLPSGRMRRSIALYYYTLGNRPSEDCIDGNCGKRHSTRFMYGHGQCAAAGPTRRWTQGVHY